MRFLQLFKLHSKAALGIDIGTHSVKLLELGKKAGRCWVKSCAAVSLPEPAGEGGQPHDTATLGAAIDTLVQQSNTHSKQAAVALPDAAVMTREMLLPADLSEADTELCVELEIERRIPYSPAEVAFDFVALNAPEQAQQRLLLAVCRLEHLQLYRQALTAAGLQVVAVDVASYAMQRAWLQLLSAESEHVVAMVHIDVAGVRLNVLTADHVLFTREQLFSAALATSMPMRVLSTDAGEATAALVSTELLDALLQQLHNVWHFFVSSDLTCSVDRFILAGDYALLPGLKKRIEQHFSLKVTVADAFAGMQFADDVQPVGRYAPAFMIACGLALRRFNHASN